jgi:hypothetical protein
MAFDIFGIKLLGPEVGKRVDPHQVIGNVPVGKMIKRAG